MPLARFFRRIPLFVVLAVSFASPHSAAPAPTPASARPVAAYGRLQVDGNRIVGADGQPVSLAGVSFFWSQWIGKYYTAQTVDWLATDWNVTLIRAALAVDHKGYLTHPKRELKKIKTLVDAAIARDLYVIIDWHDHEAEKHSAEAAAFFGEMARTYGKNPHIIYEIYNEPLKVSWSEVIKPYAETVIAAIRAEDPDNLIIVGTPYWSQRVDEAAADPIRDPNVAYTLHFYAGTHKAPFRAYAETALNAGVALFVTEWGTVNADGDGPIDHESIDEWFAFIREHHLSHANWSVSDKTESSALLRPGTSPRGHWRENQLTESGQFVRNLIRGWSPR